MLRRPWPRIPIRSGLQLNTEDRRRGISAMSWPAIMRKLRRYLKLSFAAVLFLAVAFFVFATLVWTTHRDIAYRNLHPASAACKEGLNKGWKVLLDVDPDKVKAAAAAGDKDFIDPSNAELYALQKDPIWARRFRCSLQRHVLREGDPTHPGKRPIEYYLAFLEYKENGEP